jgi:uncharacterized protein YvpB
MKPKSRKKLSVWQWIVLLILSSGALGVMALLGIMAFSASPATEVITGQAKLAPEDLASPQPTITLSPTPFQPLPTSTFTVTPSLTPTDLPSPTPEDTATPEPTQTPIWPPEEASIEGFIGHSQLFNLDCESLSAVDLAAYFGVSIKEILFLTSLPHSDNPEEGFVGDYRGPSGHLPPGDYGVHAPPIAAQLREYGLNASDRKGMTWDELRNEIASGRPVIAWVIYGTSNGTPQQYKVSQDQYITVARFEHTVIVTGYEPKWVTIQDGKYEYKRTLKQFLDSWSVLGNMAIIVSEPPVLETETP